MIAYVVALSQRAAILLRPPVAKKRELNDRLVTARAIGPERDSFDGPDDTKDFGPPIAGRENYY